MDVDGFASARALATDKTRLGDLLVAEDLLRCGSLNHICHWLSRSDSAIEERAGCGWSGYEARPDTIERWQWMASRHGFRSAMGSRRR